MTRTADMPVQVGNNGGLKYKHCVKNWIVFHIEYCCNSCLIICYKIPTTDFPDDYGGLIRN